MAEQNAKSTAPDLKETLEVEGDPPLDDEEEERRAMILRHGITWESFEEFLKVFGKFYPGR